jgi:hypothetical protein
MDGLNIDDWPQLEYVSVKNNPVELCVSLARFAMDLKNIIFAGSCSVKRRSVTIAGVTTTHPSDGVTSVADSVTYARRLFNDGRIINATTRVPLATTSVNATELAVPVSTASFKFENGILYIGIPISLFGIAGILLKIGFKRRGVTIDVNCKCRGKRRSSPPPSDVGSTAASETSIEMFDQATIRSGVWGKGELLSYISIYINIRISSICNYAIELSCFIIL